MIAILLVAQIGWTDGPKLTAQQLADVLRVSPGLSNRTNVPPPGDGPRFAITADRGAAPSPWNFPPPTPARRLDGTSLDQPPAVYGAQPFIVIIEEPFRTVKPVIIDQPTRRLQ